MKISNLLAVLTLGLTSVLTVTPAQASFVDECRYNNGYRTVYDSYGRPYSVKCQNESTLKTAVKLGGALIILGVLDEVLSEDRSPVEHRTRRQPVYYPSQYPPARHPHPFQSRFGLYLDQRDLLRTSGSLTWIHRSAIYRYNYYSGLFCEFCSLQKEKSVVK